MGIKQLDETRQHVLVRSLPLVHPLELEHLLEREPEHLELADVFEPTDVVVGIHAYSAIEALDGFEEAELLVVADRPLGQPDLRGDLPDAVLAHAGSHVRLPWRRLASSRQLAN